MLYGLGFFSGFAAILYQIVWMRQLGLIVGSSAVSVGISLSAFMAGMGLGSLALGRIADRRKRPERLYAWLESGVGAYGLLSPALFSAAPLFAGWMHELPGRAALCFSLLIIPTFLMGGTYPAAIRYLSPTPDARGRPLGLFYAANTLGAAAAAFLLPIVLLERLGMSGTTYLAVACNILAAAGAFLLPATGTVPTPLTPALSPLRGRGGNLGEGGASPYYIVGFAFFLSGLCALGLETLYNRVLILTFGSSIYSYSFILGVYLAGIGLGGAVFACLESRSRCQVDTITLFFSGQFAIFAFLLVSLPFLDRVALMQMNVFELLKGHFGAFHAANILVAGLVCGIPAIGFGISYPAALKALTEHRTDIGTRTGIWTAVNGAGTAAGSLLITFVLLPGSGSYSCFLYILYSLGMSLILVVLCAAPLRRIVVVSAIIVTSLGLAFWKLPRWDLRYFHTQIGVRPDHALDAWRHGGFGKTSLDAYQLKFFKEGIAGTVSIVEFRSDDSRRAKTHAEKNISLYVNGKIDASDNEPDMVTQSLLGHLPMHFHPAAKSALVVGFGSGVTSATLARYPLDRLDVVELSPDVVDAARRFFPHVNHRVLEDSRVRMFVEDGRNFLATRRGATRYDVIVNEPSNVWMSGAANLFTREYFALIRNRLAPGGLLCQWFQMYSMTWDNLVTLLATLHSEFPHLRVFNFSHAGFSGDLLIMASLDPLAISSEGIPIPAFRSAIPAGPAPEPHLAWLASFNDLMRGYVMGSKELDELVGPGRALHTDDRPRLELRGPRDLFSESSKSNLLHFVGHAPELTFDWDVPADRILPAMGVAAKLHPSTERGIRVVTFYDEGRAFLQRQSFAYARWAAPGAGGGLELFRPLRGMSAQPSHRLTLSEFSKKPVESAQEFRTADGRLVTRFESKDTDLLRVWLAWNCDNARQTFFVRYQEPAAAGIAQAHLRVAGLFACERVGN